MGGGDDARTSGPLNLLHHSCVCVFVQWSDRPQTWRGDKSTEGLYPVLLLLLSCRFSTSRDVKRGETAQPRKYYSYPFIRFVLPVPHYTMSKNCRKKKQHMRENGGRERERRLRRCPPHDKMRSARHEVRKRRRGRKRTPIIYVRRILLPAPSLPRRGN